MVVVTGTKRSGTSMWMQVLKAAGVPLVGEAFPMRWGEGLRPANPKGFYESTLRRGIFHETNPDPETGVYLHPVETRDAAVKVFLPGLVRTDHAFLHRVVFTVRDWRAYVRSVQRLEALDRPGRPARVGAAAALEWWVENYIGLRDLLQRRYPCQMLSYETACERPEAVVPELLEWLGLRGPHPDAVAVIQPPRAGDAGAVPVALPYEVLEVFDAFCDCVRDAEPLTPSLLAAMNDVHQQLAPMAMAYGREAELAVSAT